jgi:hypothetical protein
MQKLHFEKFLEDLNDPILKNSVSAFTEHLSKTKNEEFSSILKSLPEDLHELYLKYDIYSKETLRGEHGPTSQYWMMYVKMIDSHRKLTRAVRTADYCLYIQLLPELIVLFFAFNHQNYARWLTKYIELLE